MLKLINKTLTCQLCHKTINFILITKILLTLPRFPDYGTNLLRSELVTNLIALIFTNGFSASGCIYSVFMKFACEHNLSIDVKMFYIYPLICCTDCHIF